VELDTASEVPGHLVLALLAEALCRDLWVTAVGLPSLGGAALAAMIRADGGPSHALRRRLFVLRPGEPWGEVTAVLAEGVDLVLLNPITPADATVARQLSARLRRRGAAGDQHHAVARAVVGRWPTGRTTLRGEQREWRGLHGFEGGPLAGTGHITGGRIWISAQGRATGSQRRFVWTAAEPTAAVTPLRPVSAPPKRHAAA
jgi:hypothetical protein